MGNRAYKYRKSAVRAWLSYPELSNRVGWRDGDVHPDDRPLAPAREPLKRRLRAGGAARVRVGGVDVAGVDEKRDAGYLGQLDSAEARCRAEFGGPDEAPSQVRRRGRVPHVRPFALRVDV